MLKGRGMALACGDRVAYTRTDQGGVIESLLPRTSLFYRSDAFKERLIAANVTQVVGVVAPDLSLDEELVNRWIVAAEAEGCRFILAANKADMFGFDVLLDAPRALRRARVRGRATLGARGCSAALALDRRPEQRSDRAIGDGEIDDPQRARFRTWAPRPRRSPRRSTPAGTRRRIRRCTCCRTIPPADGSSIRRE